MSNLKSDLISDLQILTYEGKEQYFIDDNNVNKEVYEKFEACQKKLLSLMNEENTKVRNHG